MYDATAKNLFLIVSALFPARRELLWQFALNSFALLPVLSGSKRDRPGHCNKSGSKQNCIAKSPRRTSADNIRTGRIVRLLGYFASRHVDRAVASGLQTIRALHALNLRRDVDKIMQAGKRFMSPPAAVRDTDGDEEASEAISFETTEHWVQR
jgi:hypothetical protein